MDGKRERKRSLRWPASLIRLSTVLSVAVWAVSAAYEPSPTLTPTNPRELILAILPYQVPPHIYDMWSPVADYLFEKIGIPVRVTTSNVYEQYVPKVLATRPELAYFNSLQYLTAHRDAGYEAFIAPTQQMIGRIIVRVDSPIQTVEDLRDKRISYLPPSAMPGHLQPKAFLLDHGLVAGKDYTIIRVANHNLSINAVVAGKVDAGATGVVAFDTLPPETKSQLRILAVTPPQPPVVIAVRGDLDPAFKEVIAESLLSLNDTKAGRAILAPLGWKALIRVTDADYNTTREFAKKLGLEY
jgi:phosphonate transport system substrate-binding protein